MKSYRVEIALRIAIGLIAVGTASGAGLSESEKGDSMTCEDMRSRELCESVRLIRGVNLGNALEAPVEGEWGVTLNKYDFSLISDAGFTWVRVPVRWNAHAQAEAPYRIDETFFERIDWVIAQSEANRLSVLLNLHHYEELFSNPDRHTERFIALWRQIAERYADRDERSLWFEPVNEPHAELQGETWNSAMIRVISAIRESNPTRPIVVGGDNWNAFDRLNRLELPDDDRLVLTFHYYLPFPFTHQGATWVDNMDRHLGTTWTGESREQSQVREHFRVVRSAAKEHGLPVLMGEFGAYERAPIDSRQQWTNFVRQVAEEYGFGWMYWEFRAGFGVYDGLSGWNAPILDALLPD